MSIANAAHHNMIGGKRKPYKAELEFLRTVDNSSTSYKYINTGIVPTANTKWELTAAFTKKYSIIGVYCGPSGRFDIGINSSATQWLMNLGSSTSGGTADANWHTFTLDAPSHTGYVDGVATVTLGTTFSPEIQNSVICLFARGRGDRTPPIDIGGRAYAFPNMYISRSRIWQNGVLIQDLIPVLDLAGVACMYDRVSGALFYNAGSGSFVPGPEI